ncbi:MAG: EAL domain-containing protein, partial [Schwartzia sp.]|nr:EAL domain-containing protein [Schwartzia sp. (in: firmicutes)]
EALKTCKKWREIVPDFKMSINVSSVQIRDMTFFPFVREAIKRIDVPPQAVTLELTESTIVSDWTFINQQFNEFRDQGVQIAMDDFGTGYSSLAYLKNLSCDIVKVDREFVKNILENDFDTRLVEYTVTLCRSVGIRTCIEGVEENEVYEIVTNRCGADYIQGYLFGRPVSQDDFYETYLKELQKEVANDAG